jgi:hypothetical protein
VRVHSTESVEVLGNHVLDRFEGQVGVDRPGTEADEERHVVHLSSVATLDDETDLGALLLAHEVMVHSGGDQQ